MLLRSDLVQKSDFSQSEINDFINFICFNVLMLNHLLSPNVNVVLMNIVYSALVV